MCRGWIGLVDRRTAAVMPTGGLGWFPLRRPVVARAQSLWRHPGRGRRPGCPVTPRLPRGASKNLDAAAAADRWRPARSWCSLGLTAVRADRAGGRSVAGEVGHHLLARDGVNGTADAVGFGQRRGGGWAAVFTPTRWPIGEVGQHHLLQRSYMLGRTHDRTGTVGGAAMASQHHTGVGNHLQRHITKAVTHQHLPTRVTRWNRINAAPERDSGLITYRARHFHHRGITRRYRPQPLGLSQRPHRGGDTVTAAFASVKAHTQPVQPGLAWSWVTSSPRVRHQRWVITPAAFSTAPLRQG